MKKTFAGTLALLFCILISLSGCTAIGEKAGSHSSIYGAAAAISLLLLIGCIFSIKSNRFWFILLFSSVFVVNTGYTFLSVSSCLEMALWANRISYLGSVFLPLSMLMIILKLTNTRYPKKWQWILFLLSFVMFAIAASPGILPIYYKEVSFSMVDGISMLHKVYGPLHPLYLIYLLGYFAAMVAIIIHAEVKKTITGTSHAIIVALSVFVNIGVWFIEQLVSIDFEMLSVSYIISELFLLGVHLIMTENQRLREIVKQVELAKNYSEEPVSADLMLEKPIGEETVPPESIEIFIQGLGQLTPTEKAIYEAYIARVTTKEIMANMNIKETTLKFHNRNLYSKLGVSTRKELLELYKHVKSVKATLDDSNGIPDSTAES